MGCCDGTDDLGFTLVPPSPPLRQTAEDRERKARVEQYVKEYNDNERQSKENG